MPDLPADFELKLMPDWLKEQPSKNPYADYEVRDEDRRGRGPRGDDMDRRGGGGGPRRNKPGERPGGPRRDQGGGKPGGARPESRGRPEGGKRPGGGTPDRRHGGQDRRAEPHPPRDAAPATPPAEVTIEFFPDEAAAGSIAREIKSTHRAYSLFDLARMFLAKPERHRLKIAAKSTAQPLYRAGENGPILLDKAGAERAAFPALRARFYVEVSVQREPLKGNFANVARCRANGQLLGPTNYHGYQPALRKLFEERFSRRMSFAEFQREIEVVSDPALVEQWKEQARTTTVYRLKPPEAAPVPEPAVANPAEPTPAAESSEPAAEAQPETEPAEAEVAPAPEEPVAPQPEEPVAVQPEEPVAPQPEGPTFSSVAEVEQHFREHFLPGLIQSASSFQISGDASRHLPDRSLAAAVRQAWEQERGFPGQMMHHLRQQFTRAGLHVFKHKKRMQFVSLIRPAPMEGGSLSPSIAEILQVIERDARCTRATLAAVILGPDEAATDPAKKSTLASDLRWLIDTGRVIEFSDGRLELPLAPVKVEPQPAKTEPAAPAPAEAAPAPEQSEPAAAATSPESVPAAAHDAPASESLASDPDL